MLALLGIIIITVRDGATSVVVLYLCSSGQENPATITGCISSSCSTTECFAKVEALITADLFAFLCVFPLTLYAFVPFN